MKQGIAKVTSAPQLLHAFLGAPTTSECVSIPPGSGCWVCGASGYPRGTNAAKWMAGSMTDQNQCRAPGAEYVCEACVYFRCRTSPVPGRLPGPCSSCKGVKADACTKCEGTGRNTAIRGSCLASEVLPELVPPALRMDASIDNVWVNVQRDKHETLRRLFRPNADNSFGNRAGSLPPCSRRRMAIPCR